jgi:hypothetical protein
MHNLRGRPITGVFKQEDSNNLLFSCLGGTLLYKFDGQYIIDHITGVDNLRGKVLSTTKFYNNKHQIVWAIETELGVCYIQACLTPDGDTDYQIENISEKRIDASSCLLRVGDDPDNLLFGGCVFFEYVKDF